MVRARIRRRRASAAVLASTALLGVLVLVRAGDGAKATAIGRAGSVPPVVPSGQVERPAASSRPVAPAPQRPAGDAFTPGRSVLRPVVTQDQLPALGNGCEVTSLSMLLSSVGVRVSKEQLAREQPTTTTAAPTFARPRDFYSITSWGNPHRGFVGQVAGYGYGIYHEPVTRLLRSKVGERARDLSGSRFWQVMDVVRAGQPVMVWTTTTMRPPTRWVTWRTPGGPFRATKIEHAVLLVGWTNNRLLINNPLTGRREAVVPGPFIEAWKQMDRQAVTIAAA